MRNATKAVLLAAACLSIAACKVEKKQEGKLPDVDVSAKGGQLPEYNVQGPDVQVGTENKVIQVPTVDVKTPGEKKADHK
jgi:hypothetical protein